LYITYLYPESQSNPSRKKRKRENHKFKIKQRREQSSNNRRADRPDIVCLYSPLQCSIKKRGIKKTPKKNKAAIKANIEIDSFKGGIT